MSDEMALHKAVDAAAIWASHGARVERDAIIAELERMRVSYGNARARAMTRGNLDDQREAEGGSQACKFLLTFLRSRADA